MGRKVFLSVLGATFYKKCQYHDNEIDFTSDETRFVQEAILSMLQQKESWGKGDKGYIFVTKDAEIQNWNKEIKERTNWNKEQEPYFGLEKQLADLNLPFEVVAKRIEHEKDWREMFASIDSCIQDGDQLYLDVTHGFRYMPMLVLVLSNYTQFLKHTTVKGVYYGAFELKDEMNRATIMNLYGLVEILDWTLAASDYIRFGKAGHDKDKEGLGKLIKDTHMEGLKGGDYNARSINKYVNTVAEIVVQRSFCRGVDIYSAKETQEAKQLGEEVEITYEPLKQIFNRIKEEIKGADKNNPKNLLYAAQWCYNKQLYQQAITMLQEGVITFFCHRYNIDNTDKINRRVISSALSQGPEFKMWDNKCREHIKLIKKIFDDELFTNELYIDLLKKTSEKPFTKFGELSDLRNDYNHAGFRENARGIIKIQNKIKEAFDNFSPLFDEQTKATAYQEEPRQKIFLNLSNHPFSTWSEKQLAEAKQLGELREMNFPEIDPQSSEEDVMKLASEYFENIRQIEVNEGKEVVVHLMGEMNFTYALVEQLKSEGITAYASTTQRVVKDLGEGKKESAFEFVRFRAY